jgi:hypothetical protein
VSSVLKLGLGRSANKFFTSASQLLLSSRTPFDDLTGLGMRLFGYE